MHKNVCCWSYFGLKDLHEFIFAGGTIGNKFVSKFKMSLWEKILSIRTAHFNFTLNRLIMVIELSGVQFGLKSYA